MTIAEKLVVLRKEYDVTQADIAKIAEVSDKAVSTWELGKKEPRIRSLQRICSHYKIDINAFINPEVSFAEAIRKDKGIVGEGGRPRVGPAYLSLAAEMQSNGIHPDDVRAIMDVLKRRDNDKG